MDKMVERTIDNKDKAPECLEKGCYKGYNYYICFAYLCPTAYVRLPENNKWFGKNYHEIKIGYEPHGCFTFSDNKLNYGIKDDGWFVGWDYGHVGDYLQLVAEKIGQSGKLWTMSEIRAECKKVIDALIGDADI